MAPRPLETRERFIERLRAHAAAGVRSPMGVGGHHFTHAVVLEDGVWRIRELHLDPAKVEAYRAAHSSFMPEHAEALSEPGPYVLLEAASLEALLTGIQGLPWPLRRPTAPPEMAPVQPRSRAWRWLGLLVLTVAVVVAAWLGQRLSGPR